MVRPGWPGVQIVKVRYPNAVRALGAALMLAVLPHGIAWAQDSGPIIGMNFVNPQRLPDAEAQADLRDMRAAGVRSIRMPLSDDKSIALVKMATSLGMSVELNVLLQYREGSPLRPKSGNFWASHRLSDADPEKFGQVFAAQLKALDDAGVKLAAIELGNEINWTPFNGDFPMPGQGRVFDLADLSRDPEGRSIAASYDRYIELLRVLKPIRDRSTVNGRTPIVSAGLSDPGPPGPKPGARADAVSIPATFQYLRSKGLDGLVDFYGVHTYPPTAPRMTDEARFRQLSVETLTECRPSKPCWLTEWGITDASPSCPPNDAIQRQLLHASLQHFIPYIREGALKALYYYAWEEEPWDHKGGPTLAIHRCGGLTEAGKLVLSRASYGLQ